MAKKRITARPTWFGYTVYYDEKGTEIGKSRPGAFGTTVYFDKRGRIVGKGRKGFLAKEVYHDKDFQRFITTYDDFVGQSHYENGEMIGRSMPGWFGAEHTVLETEDEDTWQEDFEGYEEANIQQGYDRNTIVKNVIIFAACLLVCAVIFAVAALLK